MTNGAMIIRTTDGQAYIIKWSSDGFDVFKRKAENAFSFPAGNPEFQAGHIAFGKGDRLVLRTAVEGEVIHRSDAFVDTVGFQ